MTPEGWDKCKRIFCDAMELSVDERPVLLDQECEGNAELRLQVEKMLAAAADNASPLDIGAAERVVGNLSPGEPLTPGDVLGRYRVLRNVGQGGTSVVYLAEHVGMSSRRRFAIKVIPPAFLAGQQERFERECEILAACEHPNITRILDRGVMESGWSYLVMDYVDGTPIHKYCSAKKLAPPEIVRLMVECGRAVTYIHENLIVHCDLKPSNILVDSTGAPRILDFGIARLIEPDDVTRHGKTTRGVRPLTPDYASPEQLAGAKLTPSTDIYSLGVVLYECLANALPFDTSDSPWMQISSRIASQEPRLPSKARLTGPYTRDDAIFARQLHGDLDSIVMKTLAHDPAKRYATMDEFTADLIRYLDGEVVQARRSSIADRLGKLFRRRQRAFAEVLGVGLSIAAAAGLSFWYAQTRQRASDNRHTDELRAIVSSTLAVPEELPDSARARVALAEHLSRGIEAAAAQARHYPGLAPDLADAMVKTGDLLGNPYGVNLGRVPEARAYFRHAFSLVQGKLESRCPDIRARACLGLGDTYSHPSLGRDPLEAVHWYQQALAEIAARSGEFGETAAIVHSRLGTEYEVLGGAQAAEIEFAAALRLFSRAADLNRAPASAFDLFRRASVTPRWARATAYAEAIAALDHLSAGPGNSRMSRVAVDAHLSLGLAEMQANRLSDASREFATAENLVGQILERDPDDLAERRNLAVALRRRALIAAMNGQLSVSSALRVRAAQELRSTLTPGTYTDPRTEANSSCPDTRESLSDGDFPMPLRRGDLLIGNRSIPGTPGTLMVFSPGSRERSVLAAGGYLSDMVDAVSESRTELYVVDRSLAGTGGIVRLRYDGRHWLQKPITCSGLLRRPTAVGYHDKHLVLADADEYSVRVIVVDPDTGKQTLIGHTDSFTQAGKIVHISGSEFYLSLFWPGEGGPAEIVRFNVATRQFIVAASNGFLDGPVALGITPRGDVLAANRTWSGNGGYGDIFRFQPGGGAQRVICKSADLSRVTALVVGSEREAWYATAAAPFAPAGLFKLDLLTGETQQTMQLAAPYTLVRVE
jgi:non-specific serine/threonine protein kinase/serine/threonine-protein kinase